MCSYEIFNLLFTVFKDKFKGDDYVFTQKYVMRCAIWYHLYNLRNVKNTHGGVLILVKLQLKSTLLHGFFSCFFKLNKWYQIAQRTTHVVGEQQIRIYHVT